MKETVATVALEDGCTFVGVFQKNGERLYGKKTYPNGATYEGYYRNNVRHGPGVKTHKDGTRVEVEYRFGKLIRG
jgi:hypothetical protein